MPQKYHIITYGCQMNRADSERIKTVLEIAGCILEERLTESDIIVVNACSVRQGAIDRIWGNLKELTKLKTMRPSVLTILTGCVLPSDKVKFQTRFDAVIPIKEISKLPEIITSLAVKRSVIPTSDVGTKKTKEDNANTHPYNYFTNQPLTPLSQNVVSNNYLNIRPRHLSHFSAFVPIMTGCNAFCTYCAVPYTRGSEENRDPIEIIQEVEHLIMQENYREVTLLGQIINKYNVHASDAFLKFLDWYQSKHVITLSFFEDPKFKEKKIFKFHHLLETLALLPKKFWLRFSSSHPNWFTDELISTIKKTPNIPKHFHLPVQAGSDSVLLRMRRPYRIASYLAFIQKIRDEIPFATITTDCIVGFCGETEEEFQETLRVFRVARYDMAFTAQYSPRPDTYAFKNLKDDVPHHVKEEREKRLTEILKETALANNERLRGMTFDVLIRGQKTGGLYSGISENSKNIHVQSDQDLCEGEFVPVRVTEANPWSLKGEKVV